MSCVFCVAYFPGGYINSKSVEILWLLITIGFTKNKLRCIQSTFGMQLYIDLQGKRGMWPTTKINLICVQYLDTFHSYYL